MRTRVVHVVGAKLGGAEKQLLALLRERDAEAFDHRVLVVREGPLVSAFAELVPTAVLGKGAGVDPGFVVRLVRALRAAAPDVAHAWTETPALWVPAAARIAGVRAVVVAEVALQEWKRWPHLLADRVNYRLVTRVVGNARAVADAAISRGADPARTQVILLGVDIPEQVSATRDPATILLLARFDHRKGHEVLVRALPAVRQAHPQARVVLAGPAALEEEKQVLARVRDLVVQLGLQDAVDLPGGVDPEQLLGSATVLAVPSTSEGMPNVVLEAMAHGVPVVATTVGGIPEVVHDPETGWLVAPADVDALARSLTEALSSPAERLRRAQAARSAVRDLSIPASMRRWERVYAEVRAQRGGER